MKKAFKTVFRILLIAAAVIGTLAFLLFGSYAFVKKDIDQYDAQVQKTGNAAKFMPDLDTLPEHAEIEYTYTKRIYNPLYFVSEGLALFVTLDDAEYEAYKNEALSTYSFLQEPVENPYGLYEIPVAEFEYKGYTIKVVPDGNYDKCKSFMMLGYQDTEKKLAYLYFYNMDLDYIAIPSEDLEESALSDEVLEEEMCDLVDKAFTWAG